MSLIDTLIDRLNNQAANEQSSALDTDGSHGEFAESFGYGDSDKDDILRHVREALDGLDEDDKIYETLKAMKKRDLFTLLGNHCSLDRTGIYTQFNEIYSVIVGEIEFEIDEESAAEFAKLSPEEKAQVKRGLDFYLNDSGTLGYIDCSYDRMIMVLDPESLIAAMGV